MASKNVRRDVEYALPTPQDDIEYGSTDEGSRRERARSQLRSRGPGRHGVFDENALPFGNHGAGDLQVHSSPGTSGAATTSSSSYVPRPSQSRTRAETRTVPRAHGFNGIAEYKNINEYPKGIPRLAAFIDSSDSNAIYRRFGRLVARLLLELEIELDNLQDQLDGLDKQDAVHPFHKYRLKGFQGYPEDDQCHETLMKKIEDTACRYFRLKTYAQQINGWEPASRSQYGGLSRWIANEYALGDGQDNFLSQSRDFVSIAKQPEWGTWIRGVIEKLITWFPRLAKLCMQTDKERAVHEDDAHVDQYSRTHIQALARIIVVTLAQCILLTPIMLLLLVKLSKQAQGGLVFASVFIFLVMVTFMVKATLLEILIVTSAYAAVLTTFVGNLAH